jgi:hypothetical protein
MKRTGLLLTLLLIARITSAQTEEIFQIKMEIADISDKPKKQPEMISYYTETATDKKLMISSAARKSSLYRQSIMENAIEKNVATGRYNSAQARRPAMAGRPPKVAVPAIPPPVITKRSKMLMPGGRPIPGIGKF